MSFGGNSAKKGAGPETQPALIDGAVLTSFPWIASKCNNFGQASKKLAPPSLPEPEVFFWSEHIRLLCKDAFVQLLQLRIICENF